MKKLFTSLLVLTATAIGSVGTYAYDFEVDGLYYNIISLSDLTCALTKGDTSYSGDILIPSTVTYKNRELSVVEIEQYIFRDSEIVSIVIPNWVTEIRDQEFAWCSKLTSVEIPNSVTKICSEAFRECTSLSSVEIPNSVTEIGVGAFSNCSSLKSVEIPNSVTKIGAGAFIDCSSLKSVEIPNSIDIIPASTFYNCCSLTSIEIPNSVMAIWGKGYICGIYEQNGAFENCTSLTSVKMGNSIKSIGSSTFFGCTALTSVEIPNSVTSISAFAFANCTSLTSIVIPGSVTEFRGSDEIAPDDYIGGGIFDGCKNLTTVRLAGNENSEPLSWDIITKSLSGYVFTSPWGGFPTFNHLIIERELDPEAATSWFSGFDNGKWLAMFSYSLKDNIVYLSDIKNITYGCNTMPSWGINTYTGLEIITFTEAVEEIEARALEGCSGLKAIYCQGMTPPQLGTGSFTNEQYLNLPVYVPKGSLAAYQAAPEWCNFWELQEYDPEANGINDIQIERTNVPKDVYNMQGVCVKRAASTDDINSLAPGLYIIGGKKIQIRH